MLIAGKRKDDMRDKAILVHAQLEAALSMLDNISGLTREQVDSLLAARLKIINASYDVAVFVGQRERMK